MPSPFINMGLAFIEGFALIISPCILPILPIILSGSLAGKKARPVGIIVGFILTFTVVTLFSRGIIELAHVSQDTIRNISFVILLLLGIMMMSSYLTDKFNLLTSRLTRVGSRLNAANNPQSGFLGGLIFGGLVGIIWTPCAGPILAAVIVQVVIQTTTLSSILTVIAFAIGAGLPMLIIALLGRQIMNRFSFFRDHAQLCRQLLGFIIIVTVVYLMYQAGTSFTYGKSNNIQTASVSLINGLEHPYKAPQIEGIDAWINTPPLQLSDLKGKVVLIDFWTYSCINCLRTLPYLKDWYAKYHNDGFEIIGIHSPEFEFEHNLDNVKMAVEKYGILYPVALDNHFTTWQAFHNEYWPAHYLINKNGDVVYQHFGEGEYDVTENNIRYLLGLTGMNENKTSEESFSSQQTPETYFGYARASRYASKEAIIKNAAAVYRYPHTLPKNKWALQGKWIIYPDKIVADSKGAAIKFHFYAGKVYAVMGSSHGPVMVKVLMNDKVVENGTDVSNSQIEVTHNQLYTVINMNKEEEATVELTAMSPGLEIYTFTFGE